MGVNFLKAYRFTAAMAEDRLPSSCPHIGYPIRAVSEHRHKIAFALVIRDHQGERNETSRAAAAHFKGNQTIRPQPGRSDYRRQAVQQCRQTIWVSASVHPSQNGASHCPSLLPMALVTYSKLGACSGLCVGSMRSPTSPPLH